jgi:hypothetical protein
MATINNIDITKLNYVEGQFIPSKEFSDYIDENTTSITEEGYLYLDTEDEINFEIKFEQSFSGYLDGCDGDYWTPPSYSAVIEDDDFDITGVEIDGVEFELSKEVEEILYSIVRDKIYGTK